MQTITIEHNGFHGWTLVHVRPSGVDRHPFTGEECWVVSQRVARRVNRECCGVESCQCGESIALIDGDQGYIKTTPVLRGNYPQSV